MGVWLQIIYFLSIVSLLGLSTTLLIKYKSRNIMEHMLVIFGSGIASYIVLGAIFDILKIPIWYISYIIASGMILVFSLIYVKIKSKTGFKEVFNDLKSSFGKMGFTLPMLILIILFSTHFYIFAQASVSQPYLENDDPWGIAANTAYVKEFKTYDARVHDWVNGRGEPYAQGYHMILGTLAQITDNVPLTMKFFNQLFGSLSIFFIFLWVFLITKSEWAGVAASFALFANPSFLSRFIWPEALAISLLIFTIFLLMKNTTYSTVLAGLVIGAISMLHQRTFVITVIVLLIAFTVYFINLFRKTKSIKEIFNPVSIAVIIGFFVSLLYYGHQIVKYGLAGLVPERTASAILAEYWSRAVIPLSEYWITRPFNDMANPAGIGYAILLVSFVGLGYLLFAKNNIGTRDKYFVASMLFIFFMLHQAGRFFTVPIPIITMWKIIAIPLAVLFGLGIHFIFTKLRTMPALIKKPEYAYIIVAILIILVLFNAAIPKMKVTQSMWSPGSFWYGGFEAVTPYVQLSQVYPGERAFTSGNDAKIIGMGLKTDFTSKELFDFKMNLFSKSMDDISLFMSKHNYRFFVFDPEIINYANIEVQPENFDNLINALNVDSRFNVVFASNAAIVFEKV